MIKLNKEYYALRRPYIHTWITNKPDVDLENEISYITLATGVPVIIVLEFVMEIIGRKEELVAKQHRLMKFYQVDEII
jgi:hypothetical protein